jgi:hypothetical protein
MASFGGNSIKYGNGIYTLNFVNGDSLKFVESEIKILEGILKDFYQKPWLTEKDLQRFAGVSTVRVQNKLGYVYLIDGKKEARFLSSEIPYLQSAIQEERPKENK